MYIQKTREGCGCLWDVFGGSRGKTPGKNRETCWKNVPESRHATNSSILGTGKGKPAGNLGSTLPGPCPHLPCGVFFEIDKSSLLAVFLRNHAIWNRRPPSKIATESPLNQGPLNGGVSNGGVSRSGLVLPSLSFFVLFGTFPIFSGFSRSVRGLSGIFPICPFPLSRPINSAYGEQSRKGLRHNLAHSLHFALSKKDSNVLETGEFHLHPICTNAVRNFHAKLKCSWALGVTTKGHGLEKLSPLAKQKIRDQDKDSVCPFCGHSSPFRAVALWVPNTLLDLYPFVFLVLLSVTLDFAKKKTPILKLLFPGKKPVQAQRQQRENGKGKCK